MTNSMTTPQRQIRAQYDEDTITVYQAYSREIAEAAVLHQKLNASPAFKINRMTWIKPSWNWMMYRCGFTFKDPRQTNILALTMTHENFLKLLSRARLAHLGSVKKTDDGGCVGDAGGEAKASVIVQWDPERSVRLEKLDYRSIQIGIPGEICELWVNHWIERIEDVSLRARDLKSLLDQDESVGLKELIDLNLMPVERPYDVPLHIRKQLDMLVDPASGF